MLYGSRCPSEMCLSSGWKSSPLSTYMSARFLPPAHAALIGSPNFFRNGSSQLYSSQYFDHAAAYPGCVASVHNVRLVTSTFALPACDVYTSTPASTAAVRTAASPPAIVRGCLGPLGLSLATVD